jgi:hypothetical protein
MAAPSIVEHVYCRSALELLEALRPSHQRWRPSPDAWIFRGHADASWSLVPSVNRRTLLRRFLPDVPEPTDKDLYWEPTVGQAVGLLNDFKAALNRAGREVPGMQFATQDLVADDDTAFNGAMLALAALAQHHSIPTWLLDWSRHATFAAYFAASDVVHAPATDGDLAIWALDIVDAEKPAARLAGMGVFDGNITQLRPVELPRAGNANLHAQAGLFTLGRWSLLPPKDGDKVKFLPVDKLLELIVEDEPFDHPVLYKFTLPRSEAGALLMWLSHEPVTGAILFPGLDGVARDVRDRRRWPK